MNLKETKMKILYIDSLKEIIESMDFGDSKIKLEFEEVANLISKSVNIFNNNGRNNANKKIREEIEKFIIAKTQNI